MLPPRPDYCSFDRLAQQPYFEPSQARGQPRHAKYKYIQFRRPNPPNMVFVLQVHHSRLLYFDGTTYTQNMRLLGARYVENSKYEMLL